MENNTKKKYKAVLFDKDGVLIDSLDTCHLAFNETLKNYGKKEISKNKYKKEFSIATIVYKR